MKDNRVVAIQGDQLAEVNKGLLCVKGYHVGLALYGKDRLTTPLLRRNGKLEPVSWDEALDIFAQRVMAAPDKFAFYGSGQWTIPEGFAAQKFMKGGLANNHIEPNARLCMASAVTGYLSTYGVDEPAGCYDDLDKCNVLILWQQHGGDASGVVSRVIDRRTRGEEVTIIDLGTRRTRSTEYCQHFLQFRPHSDLAIANGIAHLLLKNKTYDAKFVERFCNFRKNTAEPTLLGEAMTFADYQKEIELYTPEHVEKISGVPAEKIRMLGELFGRKDIRITSTGAWASTNTAAARTSTASFMAFTCSAVIGENLVMRPRPSPASRAPAARLAKLARCVISCRADASSPTSSIARKAKRSGTCRQVALTRSRGITP